MTEAEEREAVEALWNMNYTAQEVAEEVGKDLVNPRMWIGRLRAKGWDLPYRTKRRGLTAEDFGPAYSNPEKGAA